MKRKPKSPNEDIDALMRVFAWGSVAILVVFIITVCSL